MRRRHLFAAALCCAAAAGQESRQATGVKVGEVTGNSAIVWLRHTARAERNQQGAAPVGRPATPLAPGTDVNALRGAAPGAPGKVRLRYATREDLRGARSTGWAAVSEDRDFSRQFRIGGLEPATRYYYAADTATPDGVEAAPLRGSFRTAPEPGRAADVTFTVITGQMYKDLDHPEGFEIYRSMLKLDPDFIVPTGDNVYYDNEAPRATTVAAARYHWQRMYSLPRLIAFHLRVPGYWEKDDHDVLFDDCWPGRMVQQMLPLTFEAGQRIFLEQVPMGERTWRTHRWGRDLQVWMTEGRDFRSPNNAPDGPEKTIWGEAQKRWFRQSVESSSATWKVLISPTPLVGPDRVKKGDNHSNRAFAHEGRELRRWIAGQKNLFIACGDRHWQYHSVDPETKVHEFSSGPASDQHADGSPGEDPDYHRFHRVKGGFLAVSVRAGKLAFVFHDVTGNVVYRYEPN